MSNDKIYDKIKAICKEKGVSIASVERQAGMSSGAISKWKTSSPTVASLSSVVNVLCVPITEVFGGDA